MSQKKRKKILGVWFYEKDDEPRFLRFSQILENGFEQHWLSEENPLHINLRKETAVREQLVKFKKWLKYARKKGNSAEELERLRIKSEDSVYHENNINPWALQWFRGIKEGLANERRWYENRYDKAIRVYKSRDFILQALRTQSSPVVDVWTRSFWNQLHAQLYEFLLEHMERIQRIDEMQEFIVILRLGFDHQWLNASDVGLLEKALERLVLLYRTQYKGFSSGNFISMIACHQEIRGTQVGIRQNAGLNRPSVLTKAMIQRSVRKSFVRISSLENS